MWAGLKIPVKTKGKDFPIQRSIHTDSFWKQTHWLWETYKLHGHRSIWTVDPKDWFRSIYDDLWLSHIFTDHVRSTTEGYVFTGVCLLTPGGGGTPANGGAVPKGTYPPRSRWGERVPQGIYPPSRSRQGGTYPPPGPDGGRGYPKVSTLHPGQDRGYPNVPTPDQGIYAPPSSQPGLMGLDNIWSTWYAAVGMPLAFTQEDFLVSIYSNTWNPSVFLFFVVSAQSSNQFLQAHCKVCGKVTFFISNLVAGGTSVRPVATEYPQTWQGYPSNRIGGNPRSHGQDREFFNNQFSTKISI